MTSPDPALRVAAVAIGRNEGGRLLRCLDTLAGQVETVIYVDSGSTDDSVAAAEAQGALVVQLDMTRPFTAARARNAGAAKLPEGIDLIQFIDGDCALQPGWLPAAKAFLVDHPDVGVVCGRRRETAPEVSIYNRLCDDEWDTPVGETLACGGDALIRRAAFDDVGGYRETMIAGEEPEMCVRLRQSGWRIWRLAEEMTLHDAALTRFGQWWRRAKRAGHAYAEGAALHGAEPEGHNVVEKRRAILWGGAIPAAALIAAMIHPIFLFAFVVYPLQVFRLALKFGGDRFGVQKAVFLTIGKFAEATGVAMFALNRIRRRTSTLIEYK